MDGQVYMDETEESFCVWRTFFSQRTQVCTYQVDVFTQLPNGTWERRFEEHRVQGGHGVLEDHGHIIAAHALQLFLTHLKNIFPLHQNLAAFDHTRRIGHQI